MNQSSKRYKLIRTLGKGSFSKVKEAVHLITGELVAIKVMDKAMISKNEDLVRIKREIKILMTASHPNIISLYEIMETERYYFFVMEHAAGGELSKYICDKQRLDEKEACRLFRQLIRGVEYLHSFGCAHRDIKPSNILLKEDLDLKLIDFGLGNFYTGGQMLETPCGSPCYAAPELVTGKSYDGITVDIWSSGITLFAMICGFLPFNDDSRRELFRKIANCEYSMPDWISPQAKDLIRKIFVANPAHRITVEQIKKHPWFNLFKEDPAYEQSLDDYATPDDIVALTSKMIKVPQDKLKQMIQENQSNKFTCCYKLFMLKRQHKRLTKEDMQFIKSRRISDAKTDLTLTRELSEPPERSELSQSKTPVYAAQKNKETAIFNELVANGALKKMFGEQRNKDNAKSREKQKASEEEQRPTSYERQPPRGRAELRVETITKAADVIQGLSISREGSPQPTPVSGTQITFDSEKMAQRSRQMIRIGSQKTAGLTTKVSQATAKQPNVITTTPANAAGRHANNPATSREKMKLTVNTTWDADDQHKFKPRKSVERANRSLSISKPPQTPASEATQRPLNNIKSIIKQILSHERPASREKSTDKAQFFKNNTSLRIKNSKEQQETPSNLLRKTVSPKGVVVLDRPQQFSSYS